MKTQQPKQDFSKVSGQVLEDIFGADSYVVIPAPMDQPHKKSRMVPAYKVRNEAESMAHPGLLAD